MVAAWHTVFTTFADESDVAFNVSYAPGATIRGIGCITHTPTHGGSNISSLAYGGVSMPLVVDAHDTVDEPGSSYIHFAGASLPAGTNNVTITPTGGSISLRGVIFAITAAADTEVVDSDEINVNQANPQLTLQAGARSVAAVAGVYSGLAAVTSLTALSGQTSMQSDDFGAHVSVATRRTAIETGNITIGWTAGTDDVAMVAACFAEVGSAATSILLRPDPGRYLIIR